MEYLFHILVMACLYVILTTSFNLLIGFAGLFALSHAAFYAFGAYATAILTTQYDMVFPLPLLIGALLTAGVGALVAIPRSEEHTSELQSLMRISYAVFCF